ncbi:MAG TPA: hypothetical protein VHV52_09650 [Gaiellaceae bacterium]|jgi:hypothetical protein|nr:hypothetical protein [Gaiellaceae bacterium]
MSRRKTSPLSESEYASEAGAARRRVISRIDPTFEFFTPEAAARVILFPTGVHYGLDESQFRALATAARAVGEDDGFYLSLIERSASTDEAQDWWVDFDDYEGYFYADAGSSETLHHSRAGSWAILALQSQQLAVGGSSAFVEALTTAWPTQLWGDAIYAPDRQVEAFLGWLATVGIREVVMRWLPSFLAHMYGPESGQKLIGQYASFGVHS